MKFKHNTKTEQELLCDTMVLEYKRDEYILDLTAAEKEFIENYKKEQGIRENQVVIGFNTGCSDLYPYKKLPFESQARLLNALHKLFPHDRILLLGGKEDTENNGALKKRLQNKALSTPTDMGLRKGILFVGACDIVVTGDTLGLHIAVALKKKIAAFFTTTCAQEIDLYDRGYKTAAQVDCTPCWKRECRKEIKCYDRVDLDNICENVKNLYSTIEKKA
jgi:heptosyltransferase-2